ncbi:MAG: DUF4296 domain-containing protein [Rikenellaceae bacterium]|nr:DUF4296 domain-containing protein [Rikenellaceae bacterium]
MINRRGFRHILLALVIGGALMAGGCAKKTIIPDDELTAITQEFFLVNAYAAFEKIDTDSLDIYTPILSRYGYTQEDFFNTLANFTERKSARFGDIIEAAIASLEWHANDFERQVRELNYIDSLAQSMCIDSLYFAKQIKVTRMKDTARLNLTMPIVDKGEYRLSYKYYIDSLDKNLLVQSVQIVTDTAGRVNYNTRNHLVRYNARTFNTRIIPKPGSKELSIKLADYAHKEERPYITLDSVSLVYIPPVEEALRYMDSLMSFKPSLITCDTVDVFKPIVATPPMLTKDSIEAISKRAEEAARKALEEKEKAAKAAKKAKKKSKKQ